MVLEDLHWADPDNVALAESLDDHLDGERLVWVLTVRSSHPSAAGRVPLVMRRSSVRFR